MVEVSPDFKKRKELKIIVKHIFLNSQQLNSVLLQQPGDYFWDGSLIEMVRGQSVSEGQPGHQGDNAPGQSIRVANAESVGVLVPRDIIIYNSPHNCHHRDNLHGV